MTTQLGLDSTHAPIARSAHAARRAHIVAALTAGARRSGLLALLLLAPLGMGARGCDEAVVGTDCGKKGTPACACEYDGKGYKAGATFKDKDGCNDCSCGKNGSVSCTSKACVDAGDMSGGGDMGGSGKVCGGLQGAACPGGEYCNFQPDALCGAADQTGKCAAIPGKCTGEYAPVCGCDDKTYGNACNAAAAGVSVASKGKCGSTPPDAGTGGGCKYDGKQYAQGDSFPSSDGCNQCSCKGSDQVICTLKACAPGGTTCGGLQGGQCATGQYCLFQPEAQCGAADQTGTCSEIPTACTKEYVPVCGCDDKTYGNACEAAAAGTSVVSKGECGSSVDAGTGSGGCRIGDMIYAEGDSVPSADCNTCTCTKDGVACTLISCDPGTACGGLIGASCDDPTQYCNFPIDTMCGSGDQQGKCTTKPQVCTLEYAPMCGCDGTTYSNACGAAAAGVSVVSEGACK